MTLKKAKLTCTNVIALEGLLNLTYILIFSVAFSPDQPIMPVPMQGRATLGSDPSGFGTLRQGYLGRSSFIRKARALYPFSFATVAMTNALNP